MAGKVDLDNMLNEPRPSNHPRTVAPTESDPSSSPLRPVEVAVFEFLWNYEGCGEKNAFGIYGSFERTFPGRPKSAVLKMLLDHKEYLRARNMPFGAGIAPNDILRPGDYHYEDMEMINNYANRQNLPLEAVSLLMKTRYKADKEGKALCMGYYKSHEFANPNDIHWLLSHLHQESSALWSSDLKDECIDLYLQGSYDDGLSGKRQYPDVEIAVKMNRDSFFLMLPAEQLAKKVAHCIFVYIYDYPYYDPRNNVAAKLAYYDSKP